MVTGLSVDGLGEILKLNRGEFSVHKSQRDQIPCQLPHLSLDDKNDMKCPAKSQFSLYL